MAFLICTNDLDAPLNMALDEVLWQEASTGSQFMRLYRWADRPVLSLGYFQDSQDVRSHPLLCNLPHVRRLTGGGAIVHDQEITYSLALTGSLAPRTNELYDRVHTALASALCDLGIPATLGDAADSPGPDAHLCFSRSDRYAVRVRGVKILGSAQRRRPECVLMHGSLILARSCAAPDILGLRDLIAEIPHSQQLNMAMAQAVECALRLRLSLIDLPSNLRQRAVALAQDKYRSSEWNERKRSRPMQKFRSPVPPVLEASANLTDG